MRKIYPAGFYRKPFLFLFLLLFSFSTLHSQVDINIGTGTTGNTTTTYPCPLQDFYEGSRAQYLFLASELTAAGMTPGNITAIRFNVLSVNTGTNPALEQYAISIGTTSTTSLTSTTWETGTVQVYGPVNYMAVAGINTFTFSTPFLWNGSSNIIVEICNGDPANDTYVSFTNNCIVPWTTGLSFNGSHNYRADNIGNGCGTATTTNTGTQTTRPNITFVWAPSGPCTNPPVTGTVTANANPICPGATLSLGLTGGTSGSGQTYQWQSSSDNTNWNNISGATSASYSGIQSANTYYRCIVTCGVSATSASLLVNMSPIGNCICIPTYTTGTGSGDYCTLVQIPGTTLNNVTGASASPYYTLFPQSGSTTCSLLPGLSYSITLRAGTFGSNDLAAWIDYNQNGVFEASELLGHTYNLGANPATTTFNFIVPIAATPGTARLRVREADQGTTAMDPCVSYTFGETEDYDITIVALPPCTAPPVAGTSVATPGSVCGGTPISLSLDGTSYGSGQTYQWESSLSAGGTYTPINTASISPFFTLNAPTVTTYYRCAVTCSGNTQYSTPVPVIVNASTPVPSITSTPTGNVCSGTGVILETPTCLACTYTWSTGATTNSITVNAAGLYSVTVANSCGSAAVSQEVILDPSPSLSLSSSTVVCNGSSITIEANGASSYSWSPATGLNTTTGPIVIASPTTTTTYTVTGTIGTCTRTLSVTVEVNAVPAAPTATASGATSICQGGNVTLTSSSATGNQWYKDGTIITGATNQTYMAIESGSYTARRTSNGCISNASAPVVVTVNAIPGQPTITQVANALQSSAPSGNQWLLNGVAITGATGATYTPTTSGQYTVQVTINGCTGIASAPFSYTITATNDPVLDKKITIAPNPVRDDLLIRYNGTGAKFSVELISINGSALLRGTFTSTYQVDMRKYSAGVYIVSIINERNGEKVRRMIIKQ